MRYPHCNPVQGQNRVFPVKFFSQGKTCFHYREPLFSLQGPCFHYRDFPVRKSTQGKPCFHYREWVCSADSDLAVSWHLNSEISSNLKHLETLILSCPASVLCQQSVLRYSFILWSYSAWGRMSKVIYSKYVL